MPAFGRVAGASPSEPYLGVIIEFDEAVMREVAEGLDAPLSPSKELGPGAFIGQNATMDQLALRLAQYLRRPVSKQTGITGNFDFLIEFRRGRRTHLVRVLCRRWHWRAFKELR